VDNPALANLLQYFAALERFDLPAAVDCFTSRVEYHHPPYPKVGSGGAHAEGEKSHAVLGRSALTELWEGRGVQSIGHHVTAFARDGNLCFAEGWSPEVDASWVSVFSVDESGRIDRYVPYSSSPAFPRLGQLMLPT
jgi:hypothetical protein